MDGVERTSKMMQPHGAVVTYKLDWSSGGVLPAGGQTRHRSGNMVSVSMNKSYYQTREMVFFVFVESYPPLRPPIFSFLLLITIFYSKLNSVLY